DEVAKAGGARRSRTADLLNAIQALSQPSYGPIYAGSAERPTWEDGSIGRLRRRPSDRSRAGDFGSSTRPGRAQVSRSSSSFSPMMSATSPDSSSSSSRKVSSSSSLATSTSSSASTSASAGTPFFLPVASASASSSEITSALATGRSGSSATA